MDDGTGVPMAIAGGAMGYALSKDHAPQEGFEANSMKCGLLVW